MKAVCALLFTTNIFCSLSSKAKIQLLWLKSKRSEHWLRGENAKISPLTPAFFRKKSCPLYSASPDLKSQLCWKGHFLSFRTFEHLLIHLQSLAEVKGGEGGTGSPKSSWYTNSGQSTPVWEWFKALPNLFSFVIWTPTILFSGMIWNLVPGPVQMLWMRPIIFYKILSENSWKERKCGISSVCRMYVLRCCHLPPGQF